MSARPQTPDSDPEREPSTSTRPSPGAATTDLSLGALEPLDLPANIFRGYELISEVHRGGQGVVYQAMQSGTRRRVALKVMRSGPIARPQEHARFEREIQILGALRHPNIVAIHESGQSGGYAYFVMDYIAGETLAEWLRGARAIRSVLSVFERICDAMDAAHVRGIVHRDLKTSNVRIDSDGQPHVLDFGLAKVAAPPFWADTGAAEKSPVGAPSPAMVTVTGEFLGSLPWSAPEQAEGRADKIDARTDVYALGVMLYQSLTGKFPYPVDEPVDVVRANIRNRAPAPLRAVRREIDVDLETIVLKCLAKERERRYADAGELLRDIRRYQCGLPIDARRESLLYIVGKRGGALARKHPLACRAVVLVVVVAAADWIAEPLLLDWTHANRPFEQLMSISLAPADRAESFQHVRVIAITDATDVESLAQREGIQGVSRANRQSWRRLHGRFMERLAPAPPAALTWDICFEQELEFDADFVRGAAALNAAGAPVVIGVYPWRLDRPGLPSISPHINPLVRSGCVAAGFQPNLPWRLDIAVQRGDAEPLPSLALAAVGAFRRPDARATTALHERSDALTLRYWRPSADGRGVDLPTGDTDRFDVTAVCPVTQANVESGLRDGDRTAYYVIRLPTDGVLTSSTIAYEDIFAAGQEQLRAWLAGRIAVVGYADERFGHPDGRRIAGCYGHAAAIDSLVRRASIRVPGRAFGYVLLFGAAALGLGVAQFGKRRVALRYLGLAAILVLGFLVSIVAYRSAGYLCNPLFPGLSMWLACELGAGLNRISGPRAA